MGRRDWKVDGLCELDGEDDGVGDDGRESSRRCHNLYLISNGMSLYRVMIVNHEFIVQPCSIIEGVHKSRWGTLGWLMIAYLGEYGK